ncbi:MAG: MBL fold metallo-hydrolase [Candidatus Lokiarchaeota archaeon]|nr:MBL fold metallo-hydrolase [Candidatus Lokiarchaeota archaeon]MBD3341185.1 MBL fold metallo-hydrolase [Candidatus Lokiarchaeota archaeon]
MIIHWKERILQKFKADISLIKDVYRIKIDVPFDVKFVCCYLFKVDNFHILYDAGLNMGNWAKQFIAQLKKINKSIADIDFCIVSHHHLDHIGLLRKFKRKNPQMKIVMGKLTDQMVKWETNPKNSDEIKQIAKDLAEKAVKFGLTEEQGEKLVKWFTMWPKLRRYQRPDRLLKDGDMLEFGVNKIEAIWTPGHSLGHICIFDETRKYLFSGDHILSRITPHIGNFLVNPDIEVNYDFTNILKYYLDSLDRISELKPEIIFPAHQEVIYDPLKRITEIKEHHSQRLKQISNLIRNNPMTPLQIAMIHFGEDLDEMNSYLALSEVVAHLIYMEDQGKVERVEKDGKFFFKA